MRRLRDWIGTAATIVSAVFEHWLGETVVVAVLTAVVVIFGAILWRRVSLLMAAPRTGNCEKAYAVENRLVGYMGIMAPLSPIVTAGNATFLAGLSKLPHQSGLANDTFTGPNWGSGERGYVNSSIDYINVIDGNLQSHGFMS